MNQTNAQKQISKTMSKRFISQKLGKALTQTIESFDLQLLYISKKLLQIIHDYVFADESHETLTKAITRAAKTIELEEENLEILLLALQGARMIVQENNFVSPKQFDRYMLAKKFKVKEQVLLYHFRRTQDFVASNILKGIDGIAGLTKTGIHGAMKFTLDIFRPIGAKKKLKMRE